MASTLQTTLYIVYNIMKFPCYIQIFLWFYLIITYTIFLEIEPIRFWRTPMSLSKLDHVAMEVHDLDAIIDQLVGTGGMKVLRTGVLRTTGARLAMVGDPAGMKLELIENKETPTAAPR